MFITAIHISVDNLLCKREGMKVMILDFQLARFDDDDGPGDRKAWKYDDIAMLWRIFDILFGVEDDRPKASLGVSWGLECRHYPSYFEM